MFQNIRVIIVKSLELFLRKRQQTREFRQILRQLTRNTSFALGVLDPISWEQGPIF